MNILFASQIDGYTWYTSTYENTRSYRGRSTFRDSDLALWAGGGDLFAIVTAGVHGEDVVGKVGGVEGEVVAAVAFEVAPLVVQHEMNAHAK